MLPTATGTSLPNLQPQTLFSKHLLRVLKGSSRENLPELECVSFLVPSLCSQFLEAPRSSHTTPWWPILHGATGLLPVLGRMLFRPQPSFCWQ